ncbi:alpha/beta fold hydrolase [Streptococcus caviae]|uniref:alpha/beta fold hydrolase n=1 Tax=Streptococcus sp. 'caviae' TaxID=1915004 RepID=UPI00094B8467|nr:alpha/beta hydrolase [Streptococcus sp. 'caviae']OLN83014.1 alpha/beta hydrolase [Streptococcus sp. 'caviae']
MYKARNKRLTFNGSKIDYLTFGNGNKPLVLILGLSTQRLKGKAFSMSYIYRIFAKAYKVYMFDRRDQAETGYSIADMADELAQAMKYLNLEKADIIGLSQGGMIAQLLAIRYPELVHKLVLGITLSKVNDTALSTIGNWIKLAKTKDKEQLILDAVNKVFSESWLRRYRWLIFLLSKLMKPKELDRFVILADSILHFDAGDKLKEIACPVFVIGGGKDKVVGAQSSADLAQALNCACHIYPNLGHSAYVEAKDFNQRILTFLQS